jgi:hypothetical protein
MPDRLGVYNEAVAMLREPLLNNLIENDDSSHNKVLRRLNDVYPRAVRSCLEAGNWNFAEEMVWLARANETPTDIWDYYYSKPTGWVRTAFISATGLLDDPLHDYRDVGGMIAANANQVFMRAVTDKYKDNPAYWSQAFADYVSSEIAVRAAPDLVSASADFINELKDERKRQKGNALALDAMANPPDRMGRGRWVRAARGGRGGVLSTRGT